MNKALVIAPQPFFTPRGTPFSVYYRTLVSAELGFEIDLLTYGQGQDVSIPGVRIIRAPAFRFLGPVKVGPSFAKAIHDLALLLKTVRLLVSNRYSFVHAHEEAVFFCLLLKPLFRFRLIYDMHSSLPRQLSAFEFTRSRLLIRIFEKLEDASLRRADAVITICEDLFQYADGKISDGTPHALIENSIFEPIRPAGPAEAESSSEPLDDEGGHDRPRIVYAGTLEPYQGIDLLLKSMRIVVSDRPEAQLVIAGGRGDQVTYYKNLAEELEIGANCTFTGSVSKHRAAKLTKSADVLVSPRISGTNTPLKLYEMLASGIPIVATDIYSHRQVLTDEVAFLGNPEPESVGHSIVAALKGGPDAAGRSSNALKLYSEKYSRERYSAKLKHILESVR